MKPIYCCVAAYTWKRSNVGFWAAPDTSPLEGVGAGFCLAALQKSLVKHTTKATESCHNYVSKILHMHQSNSVLHKDNSVASQLYRDYMDPDDTVHQLAI